jgi:hypothetical protein
VKSGYQWLWRHQPAERISLVAASALIISYVPASRSNDIEKRRGDGIGGGSAAINIGYQQWRQSAWRESGGGEIVAKAGQPCAIISGNIQSAAKGWRSWATPQVPPASLSGSSLCLCVISLACTHLAACHSTAFYLLLGGQATLQCMNM